MLEVPSLLWQLDELMKAVDFVSVGSNDLFQFVMAADRGNTQLSDRFDTLSVPFLRVLKQIADAGARNHTPVTLCGELAGRPISAMALIGIGYRSISMSPASIGPVKAMLTELPVGELTKFFEENLAGHAANLPMRALLHAFADDRGIPL
jgi:phosphotransferase system enzyme I (PtsP)